MSKHTYDIAHERDLNLFVAQHFDHLAARVTTALFAGDTPILHRGEPLTAAVAVETICAQAVAVGNHPHLVIAVAARAAGVQIRVGREGHEQMSGAAPQGFLDRIREETRVAVADTMAAPSTAPVSTSTPVQSVPGVNGEKIRIVRAGEVAARVMQVLTDFELLAEPMRDLGDEMTFALYGRLSTEIAKLITQGLQ